MSSKKAMTLRPHAPSASPSPSFSLPTKPVSVQTSNTLMKSSQGIHYHQCQAMNDKFYLVELTPYGNQLLERLTPVLEQPAVLENAVYVYVVLSLGHDAIPKLYLMKTLNSYEIGTKHQQLIYRIACQSPSNCSKYVLYYAGELLKNPDNSIVFNFISGTYMKDKLTAKKQLAAATTFVTEHLLAMTNHAYSVEFVQVPFISPQSLPLTAEDLQLYVTCGATVREFTDKQECVKYKEFYNQRLFVTERSRKAEQLQEKLLEHATTWVPN